MHCGHCGCLLVGELKKGKYVYYHCTGNRGKCPEPYTRQEILAREFANVLQDLVIPESILAWLSESVLSGDQTEQAARAETAKRLQERYDHIKARIETMYLDKLDGRVTQDFFDNRSAAWRSERDGLLRKIQDLQEVAPAPVDQAIDMLRSTSRVGEVFLQQAGTEPSISSGSSRKGCVAERGITDNPVRTFSDITAFELGKLYKRKGKRRIRTCSGIWLLR